LHSNYEKRSVGQGVKTPPFHGGITGSIPVRSTSESRSSSGFSVSVKKSRATSRALIDEFKNANPMLLPYKPAKLYSGNGDLTKEWYIEYYYLEPGEIDKYRRFKERFDINRIKTYQERLAYGKEFVRFLNEKLKNGFNPFEAVKVVRGNVEVKILAQIFSIVTELSQMASSYSISTYTEHYNRLTKYIKEKQLEGFTMFDLDMEQAKRYKKWLQANQYARKTINSTFSYLSQFWDLGIEKKWVSDNPFKTIPRVSKKEEVRTTEVERFEPLTSAEMDKIFEHLIAAGENNFITYLAMIYYAWVRPIEITRLKISDLDFSRDAIRFRKSETKNNTAAYVQMVPPLKKLLSKIDLQNLSADQYLFSKDGFRPGYDKMDKHFGLEKWRAVVKEGLGIQKDMYALKHTGNIEYLLNNKGNVDLKWQQKQNRHSSSVMTDNYNRKLGLYFIEVGDLNFRHFQ
jgi:integrase